MRTYERVFQCVKPSCCSEQNGHALRNKENLRSLAITKAEIEKTLGVLR